MLKKMCITISMMIFFAFSGCGASNEATDNTNVETSDKKLTSLEPEYEQQQENVNEESMAEEIFFAPDCSEDEINALGNSYANLSLACVTFTYGEAEECLTGRVTGQGDWIYWYENGAIKKRNAQGDTFDLAYVEKASSLNVVGDWIYYLVDDRIERIRTDGKMQEIVLENVCGSFFINENVLYYVTNKAVSAANYEYYIQEYDISEECIVQSYISEMNKMCPTLIGMYQGEIWYYYWETMVEDSYYGYYIYVIDENGSKNYAIIKGDYGDVFAVYMIDSYLGWSHGYEVSSICNLESGAENELDICVRNVCNKGVIGGYSSLDYYEAPKLSEVGEGQFIINEGGCTIREVYIVGEYIYYTIDDYEDAAVYRVKIDGTDWCQL